MRRCPDLPIPGVGCSGIRCQPWEHSGVWPPRPGPAAFPGLFIIRVAQGWDWVFIFFFRGCIKSAKKGNGTRLSDILSVASLFVQGVCISTWIGRQRRDPELGTAAGVEPGARDELPVGKAGQSYPQA